MDVYIFTVSLKLSTQNWWKFQVVAPPDSRIEWMFQVLASPFPRKWGICQVWASPSLWKWGMFQVLASSLPRKWWMFQVWACPPHRKMNVSGLAISENDECFIVFELPLFGNRPPGSRRPHRDSNADGMPEWVILPLDSDRVDRGVHIGIGVPRRMKFQCVFITWDRASSSWS